jgi:NitT/TauT family transport system permease protein
MLRLTDKKSVREAAGYLSGVLVLLLVWHVIALWLNNPVLLPSPWKAMAEVVRMFLHPAFYREWLYTILRGLAGFAIALMLALCIGLASASWRPAWFLFSPLLGAVRSTPVISFILLALIWFGSENVPVFIAILTMLPLISFGIIDGIRNTDGELLEMANSFRVSRWNVIRHIYVPSLLPFLFNGMSNAMGFGWRAVIIGEVLSQPFRGIGSRMRDAQNYLNVPELIGWTLVAILTGYLFETLVRRAEKSLMRWKSVAS